MIERQAKWVTKRVKTYSINSYVLDAKFKLVLGFYFYPHDPVGGALNLMSLKSVILL